MNFQFSRYQDAILTIDMAPSFNVFGCQGEFFLTERKGGDRIFTKSFNSGYTTGQSGITVTNTGIGRFNVTIDSVNTSGLDFGNYFATFKRLNSGFITTLSEGYITVK